MATKCRKKCSDGHQVPTVSAGLNRAVSTVMSDACELGNKQNQTENAKLKLFYNLSLTLANSPFL